METNNDENKNETRSVCHSEPEALLCKAYGDESEGFRTYYLPAEECLFDTIDNSWNNIHSKLVTLDDLFIERLFGSSEAYSSIIGLFPIALVEGGFNPEMPFDRDSFNDFVQCYSFEEARRIVYLEDLRYLSDSFFEAYDQAVDSLKKMFSALDEIEPVGRTSDGLYMVSSERSRQVMREVEWFIIRLCSSLDSLNHLLHELEGIPNQFETFKKIGSKKAFQRKKDKSKKSHSSDERSIYTDCPEISYLESLRDEVIHNRSFEALSLCYINIENSAIKDRFFLIPDSTEDGKLTTWNGRCRFYSQEKKGTEHLPQLCQEVSIRILNSLTYAIEDLSSGTEAMRANGELYVPNFEEVAQRITESRQALIRLFSNKSKKQHCDKTAEKDQPKTRQYPQR